MSQRFITRSGSLLAAGALAAAALAVAAPTAQAAPVFVDSATALDVYADASTNTASIPACQVAITGGAGPSVPVVENGPAALAATSLSATFSNTGTPADTATGSTQTSGTAKITSAGGSFGTLDFSASSAAQLTDTPNSPCNRTVTSGVTFDFRFAVTNAGFLDLEMENSGGSFGQVRIYDDATTFDAPSVNNSGLGYKFNANTKVYLAPGTYRGSVTASSYRDDTGSASGTTTVHAEFAVAGSQTEAVSGKGKKHITLPAARSCATDSIDATITSKKKRAKQIQRVTFFVNDEQVKRVKTPGKKDVVKLAVADGVAADVVAEIQLFPVRKGAPAKTREVSASYEACS